jgi:hypothetical protein
VDYDSCQDMRKRRTRLPDLAAFPAGTGIVCELDR